MFLCFKPSFVKILPQLNTIDLSLVFVSFEHSLRNFLTNFGTIQRWLRRFQIESFHARVHLIQIFLSLLFVELELNKTWSSVSNSILVLPSILYPLSLPLFPYPLVLLLSQNLGEDSSSSSRCCYCCCYQAKVKSTPSAWPKTWSSRIIIFG